MSKKVKKKEREIDHEALMEEEFSIVAIIFFVFLFVFIGINLGYILYKLSLNSSGVIMFNKFL